MNSEYGDDYYYGIISDRYIRIKKIKSILDKIRPYDPDEEDEFDDNDWLVKKD